MRRDAPSRTAEFMALFRALESLLPANRRLFNDPFAKYCLSPSVYFLWTLARIPGMHGGITKFIDRRWPGARTSAVGRTRAIDDAACLALESGILQVVLLGAGFDSRAYRLPGMERVTVYEVDHPATSGRKREVILHSLENLPTNVRYVGIDFNKSDLEAEMKNAGYKAKVPTLFVWEGVTNYLTAEAIDSTLDWCSKAAPGSQLVFTYIDREVLANSGSFYGTEKIVQILQDVGERWTFGLEPAKLASFLKERGFKLESDLNATQYRKQYFKDTGSRMKGYEFYRVAVASVI
jgi:methyltransferase (TIGR00027 family)